LKKGDHVLGIFIDLSIAFDTIDHKILLSKLESYGIRGEAHKLLKSYLINRKQHVSVLNEISRNLSVVYVCMYVSQGWAELSPRSAPSLLLFWGSYMQTTMSPGTSGQRNTQRHARVKI
jgi:hypothetical protein